jgi:hypothetical protein
MFGLPDSEPTRVGALVSFSLGLMPEASEIRKIPLPSMA